MVLSRSPARSWQSSPIRFMRRAFSDRGAGVDSTGVKSDPSILLREVMRNVAQPVAIAVTSVPPSSPLYGRAKYHGATLTSFTSLTLYPHPLVAFSLRLPSRMAECLRPWRTHSDHAAGVGAGAAGTQAEVAAAAAAILAMKGEGDSSRRASSSIRQTPSASQSGERQRHNEKSDTPIKPLASQLNRAQSEPSTPTQGIRLPPKKDLPWPLSKLPMPEQPPEWAQSLFAQIPNPLSASSSASERSDANPLSSPSSRLTKSSPESASSTTSSSSSSPSSSSSSSSSLAPPSTPSSSTSTAASSLASTPPAVATPLIPPNAHPTPLTISLLSTLNEEIANQLSLPRTDHSSIFAMSDTWADHLTHPPSLIGAVGALQCEVVGSVLLRDLCGSAAASTSTNTNEVGSGQVQAANQNQGEGSELFICRVVDVEFPPESEEAGDDQSGKRGSLLHWRRKYVSVNE